MRSNQMTPGKLLGLLTIFAIVAGSLAGCASLPETRKIVLHPISQEDIFFVPKGTQCGENTTKKDGYFLSKEYVKEVLDVGIELQ